MSTNAIDLASNKWYVHQLVHLMKQYWSRKKCGWVRCTECDNANDEKCKAYKEVCQMFLEEWNH
eukprot:10768334-Lingulodinium_polyedra.AAC.1